MAVATGRPVAVVTEADDRTADLVITEINRRGVPVVRFDPADVGATLTIAARFGGDAASPTGRLRTPSRTASLDGPRSVYWRRPRWPDFEHLDAADARFAAAQARHGLGGVLYSLVDCRHVNHPLRTHEAEHKPLQLSVAQRLGFRVPPTVVTNDPAEARDFIAAHRPTVYKALRWTPYRRQGSNLTTWTQPVTAAEVDDSLTVTPHLFQARVDKVADVRVVVVGTTVFAVRIESDLLDWREDYGALAYRVVDLPDGLERSLLAYLRHFRLASGSFDLAVDRSGAFHWLELNPNGQWGWLEAETGLELSAAFAELLTEPAV